LREFLFGYGAPAPEPWSPKMQRRLLIWGYGSWLWRAALFFGIALAVYHLFFKVLGIFLMLVELVWFIFLPIMSEWRQWWTRREQAYAPRVLLSGMALLGLLLMLVVPWRSAVELPTMLEAGRASALHAPVAARVKTVNVHDGEAVAQGQVLIELESPDLDSRQAIVRREIQIQQLQMRRQASRSETAADAGIVEQRLAEAVAEYRGLAAQRERLLLRAPHAGKVRDLLPQLAVGRWLSSKDPLARVVEDGARLRGYLAEVELWRVATGASGRFIADDPMHPAIAVQLSEIDTNGAEFVDQEALTSDHHGPIAVRRDQHQRAEPVQAQYGARLSVLEEVPTPVQPLRGIVVLQGRGESLLGVAWRRLAALGVRESGF
jgi:putative peptide zinc metalloprotease protein